MAPALGELPPGAEAAVAPGLEEDGGGDAAAGVADALLASDLDEKLRAAAFAADIFGVPDAPCPCASVEPLFELPAPAVLPSDAVFDVAPTLRARLLPPPSAIASLAVVAAGCGAAPFGACTNAAPDIASTSVEGGPELTALLWLPDLFARPVASVVEDGGCAVSAETAAMLGGVPEGAGVESRTAELGVSAAVPVLLLLPCAPAFAALAADAEDFARLCGAGGASAAAPACVSIDLAADDALPCAAPGSGTTGRVASPAALLAATGATLRGAVVAASALAGAGADAGSADFVAAAAVFGFGAGAGVAFAAWAARRR